MKNLQESARLAVLEGRQAGSFMDLTARNEIRVGNDIDNDVVLYSGKGSSWCVSIRNVESLFELTVLEGEVEVDGSTLGTGENGWFESSSRVRHDALEFTVELPVISQADVVEVLPREEETTRRTNDSASGVDGEDADRDTAWSEPYRIDRGPAASTVDDQAGVDHGRESGFREIIRRTRTSPWLLPTGCLFGGLLMLSIVPALAYLNRSETPDPESLSLEQRLKSEGYDELVYSPRVGNEPATISGVVQNRNEKIRVHEIASLAEPDAIVSLQINDELVQTIQDVFRVNGIDALVSVTELGKAHARTYTDNVSSLAQIETQLKKDIAGLAELTIENHQPEAVLATPTPKRAPPADPEKRITLVVTGKTGYVMTADLSRYFVGSVLPSGHVVKSIQEGSVLVAKDGEEIKLQF